MEAIRGVLHSVAEKLHLGGAREHPHTSPKSEDPDGVYTNPVAGVNEPGPDLVAGDLHSPRFLPTEAEYFHEARRLIEASRSGESLCVQMFEFENEKTNGGTNVATRAPGHEDHQALLPALEQAAARGVKVQVLLDATWDGHLGDFRNAPVVHYLVDASKRTGNITVDYYPPGAVNIDHAKELVHLTPAADGKMAVQEALVGGSNWGNHTPANDDGGATFHGRDALGAAAIFFRDQAYARGDFVTVAEPPQAADAPVTWKVTSPHNEGGGSSGIYEAKMALTQEADQVYVNQFCLTHGDLVDAIAAKGPKAHVRLDPNEKAVNAKALWQVRDAGGEAEWADTNQDPKMVRQKSHQKLDVYVDAAGTPFALTMGSANDTAHGLHIPSAGQLHGNHEIDAVVRRVTTDEATPEGPYSTAPLLDAALAKTRQDLASHSVHDLPGADRTAATKSTE